MFSPKVTFVKDLVEFLKFKSVDSELSNKQKRETEQVQQRAKLGKRKQPMDVVLVSLSLCHYYFLTLF